MKIKIKSKSKSKNMSKSKRKRKSKSNKFHHIYKDKDIDKDKDKYKVSTFALLVVISSCLFDSSIFMLTAALLCAFLAQRTASVIYCNIIVVIIHGLAATRTEQREWQPQAQHWPSASAAALCCSAARTA